MMSLPCFVALFLSLAAFAQPPDTAWTYTYASSINDKAFCIVPTADGELLVGGIGRAPDSTNGGLVIRLSTQGSELWIQRYIYGIRDISMLQSGFAFVSFTDNHIEVAKSDDAGLVVWSQHISSLWAPGRSICAPSDGGLAVLGVDDLPFNILLVKLNANGDSIWAQDFGGESGFAMGQVAVTSDAGFVVCSSEDEQCYVAKLDSGGFIEWSTTFGSPDLSEYLSDVTVTTEGDYVVCGAQLRSIWGSFNPFAARISTDGDTIWTRVYPELGPGWLYSAITIQDSLIVMGGTSGFDYVAMIVNPNGDTVWTGLYGTAVTDAGMTMCRTPDDGLALAGYKHTIASQSEDIWVVQTESANLQFTTPHLNPSALGVITCYPNPFNGSTQIGFSLRSPSWVNLSVYDICGHLVRTVINSPMNVGEHKIVFLGQALPSGFYFYQFLEEHQAVSGRMLLLK